MVELLPLSLTFKILDAVEHYYSCNRRNNGNPACYYAEALPDVDFGEIRTVLGQLKNNKTRGDDGVTKLLKAGGTPALKVLTSLFNAVIQHGKRGTVLQEGRPNSLEEL